MTDESLPDGRCQQCKKQPAMDPHMCPYAIEINDNHETPCNCCRGCEQECCDDI